MGRQKIEIKKIECATKRRTTFLKRSRGIIKKVKELAILCGIEVEVIMFSPTGKPEHFSNRERTQQVNQGVHQNTISSMPEEEMTNMQAYENGHIQIPIQHTQVGNNAAMCAGHKEELKFGCCGDPSVSSQQMGSGQVYWTPCTSSSSGGQSALSHLPMQQQQQGWAAPNGNGQVTMQGASFVEMGNPFPMQTSAPGPGYMRGPQTMQPLAPNSFSMQTMPTSEVRGSFGMPFTSGVSGYMRGPLVGGHQMALPGGASNNTTGLLVGGCQRHFSSAAQPSSSQWGLPEGETRSNVDPTFKLESGNSRMDMYNN